MSEKNDSGKIRYDLIPPECLEDIAALLTHGADKYSDYGWQGLVKRDPLRYYSALMRHLEAWRRGEMFDQEFGLSHLAHAAVNIIFLLWGARHGVNLPNYQPGIGKWWLNSDGSCTSAHNDPEYCGEENI